MKAVFLLSLAALAMAGKVAFLPPAESQAATQPFAVPPAITVSALESAGRNDQS
ncbi:hypothetical protein [Roseovarius spongiae]|uniref:hypothetical protein n=1 Tax=Roseovarius spongiae TaxID=2320272 RepID=UPI00140E43F8|nr:hypothetical protein [Roseovarius spongiae]